MRLNEPVTQNEYQLPAGTTLMSTTDPKGRITYANEAFVRASGFAHEELKGEAHNVVRHPDMPAAAFADLWQTLKAGELWTALVKNRRKNGDHYWVRANAVPVVRNGTTVGYMSVRTRPERAEIAAAEALYRDMRAGKAEGLRISKGIVVHTGWQAWRSWHKTAGARARIRLHLAAMWGVSVLALAGLDGGAAQIWAHAAVLGALAALCCWALERQVARPLEQLKQAAFGVASGARRDIGTIDRSDEIGMVHRAISQLGLMFRWLIEDVSVQVRSVQTAADEIAQGNNDLASRTESASGSVQATATSMGDITDGLRASSQTALEADRLSSQARSAAGHGGEAVSQVVSTMKDISASSQKIADIISVIDSIAFQTNILALNAAVEAARAGEQGRGFAVVAGEVRSLAQRSASAAKEIKDLINSSVAGVEAGSRMVDEAGSAMDGIVAQVRQTSDLIGAISQVLAQQERKVEEVNQSIAHLDQVTQQNAALVEQSAAASASLHHQSVRLNDAVSVFQ